MKYTAKGKYNRHLELNDVATGKILASLTYKGWFTREAEISTAKGDIFTIKTSGFWRPKTTLKNREEVICELLPKMSGKGRAELHMSNGQSYSYKHKRYFKQEYGLFSPQDQELISVVSKFSFAMMGFTYNIETNDNYKEANDSVLILLLLYYTNHMRAKQSAG